MNLLKMMKKKNKFRDESASGNNNKTPNNKENTSINDNQNQDISEELADNQNEDVYSIEEAETDKIDSELKETIVKLAEIQDKYLRLSAEFDNYRKRTLKEKMEISKYASEDILLKILPFMDDFDRAIKHLNENSDYEGMKDGIELIYNKFDDFLKQNSVKEIEAADSVFNVDIHEAVAKTRVNEEDMKGKIVDVVQKGYYLNDRVLRFSKVVVGE